MDPDVALHLQIAAVVVMAVIIIALAVAASGGACDETAGATGSAAVHDADVEAALGDDTLMTYKQAAARKKEKEKEKAKEEQEEERCAICLSEYGEGEAGELVRVVPACGHFYHASCEIDGWLRKRRTCPLCRGGLGPPPAPLPGLPRPECPRMPPSH
ncbi:E3 ubiquitin-protein ligase EL5-like [Triticum dicoccoides]|uniref:E3 ubiquitin-protein ligase EL5-like n=1 Tax=Triticum dicoccoides TaxID=85692 RepID=UPI00188F6D1E|nr:E3 ubiquitin-protein ligase EL5-like [Triticum dicoccoides]